jgi:FtsP/CotA-like multicopper oxidase with cupredoxin domain
VTREYWLVLDQAIAAPDGVSRYVQVVNGTSPGPTISASWGDWVVIHVLNNMPDSSRNGTTIHWHGIRQNYTNQMDGVSSVTQCPIVPGQSYTYRWRATQYGSSWYHSHWGLQAWEGVFGGIVIHGPASSNYDADLGNLFLSDWTHTDADDLYATAALGAAVTYDTGLINGTMVWDDGNTTVGNYFETSFISGTSYLLRLVNVAIDSGFKFMIDNHTLTVIASDFVPIEPYTADYVQLTMGQRYDVIVTANAASIADEFWMRSIPQSACSANANQNNILGIVRYTDSDDLPTTTGYTFIDECVDESQLVPVVSKTVGGVDALYDEPASVIRNAENFVSWTLNGTSYLVHWNDPVNMSNSDNRAAGN